MGKILRYDQNSGKIYLPGEIDFFPQEGKKVHHHLVACQILYSGILKYVQNGSTCTIYVSYMNYISEMEYNEMQCLN